MFIAVDGIDGAGKTTLVRQLADLFAQWHPLVTKEPTNSSKWGRALRDSAIVARLPKEVEIEYFHLDRLHHIETEIRPALKNNRVVITDRYVDSTLAFQADDPVSADRLYELFKSDILIPHLTFILDCAVDTGLRRIAARENGNLSTYETKETLLRARSIYTSRKNGHYVKLDANGSIECTLKQALEKIEERFPNWQAGFLEHIRKFAELRAQCCSNSYDDKHRLRA